MALDAMGRLLPAAGLLVLALASATRQASAQVVNSTPSTGSAVVTDANGNQFCGQTATGS